MGLGSRVTGFRVLAVCWLVALGCRASGYTFFKLRVRELKVHAFGFLNIFVYWAFEGGLAACFRVFFLTTVFTVFMQLSTSMKCNADKSPLWRLN